MELKQTYELQSIHDSWESVYRTHAAQDRLNASMLDRILKRLGPAADAVFLDAGCGAGYHTRAIARHGYRCVGVDISETILAAARAKARAEGLQERASFQCQKLEQLDFEDGGFDVVHCRGVLMHVPAWDKALAELCRVLKPGGHIVILESNAAALEASLVRCLRRFKNAASRLVEARGGLEFWSEKDGQPFLVRITKIEALLAELRKNGVHLRDRLASEFWDIYRFSPGLGRELAIRFNQLWFGLRLPYTLSVGNVVIGRKG